MDSNIRQAISDQIFTSLKNIDQYNPVNFVEDSIRINTILNSELRNISDFKLYLNKLRAILRDNKPLFCSLFTNLIPKYLQVLSSENMIPEEYIFVLVDIVHNRTEIKKYYKKWVEDIIFSLVKFYAVNAESKSNEQISKICTYIEFLFEEFIFYDDYSINNFIVLFEKQNISIQKMSAFLFFKYIYSYDINKIKIIDWKYFFESCVNIIDGKTFGEDNKAVAQDIFKQILLYFNKLNVDPNDVLIEGKSYTSALYFQNITGFNTDKAKAKLKEYV